MTNDFIALASSCLTACCSEPPMGERAFVKERAKRDREIAAHRDRRRRLHLGDQTDEQHETAIYGGPLWSVSVAVPAGVLPKVFEYAQTREVELFGVRGKLTTLKAEEAGWTATVEATGRGRTGSVTGSISYGGKWEHDVATGEWVECAYGQWRVTEVFPRLTAHAEGCDIRFGAEFKRPGTLWGWTHSGLDRIEVRGNRATPFVSGSLKRLKTWMLPDIVLTESKAPATELFVEGKR